MSVLDSIGKFVKKITDIIMPMENVTDEEELKETKKPETKDTEKINETPEAKPAEQPLEQPAPKTQPLMQNFQTERQAASGGIGGFTRTRVNTSESGVTTERGMRYEAYTSEASVRPSLAVVKTAQMTMKIYSPTKYDEQVKLIGEDLIKRSSVVVNYEGMDEATQQRIGDFILGVVYTINGHVEMISNRIFLYVPEGFEVETAQAAMATKMRKYT